MGQSEAILEIELIKQLTQLGYNFTPVHDGDALLSNLKSQLEQFNKTSFTTKEFGAILNHLAKGNVFEKAKTLRDRFNLTKEDGTTFYVRFFFLPCQVLSPDTTIHITTLGERGQG